MLFIIPNLLIFVQLSFVQLVEKSKRSWLVDFLSLFVRLLVLITMMMVSLPNLDVWVVAFLLFHVVINCDVNTVWIVLGWFVVFGFKAGLAEQAFYVVNTSLKFDGFEFYFFESLK